MFLNQGASANWKGVIWCDFLFSLSFVCYVAACARIRSAELQSLSQKDLFNLKEKADPDWAKTPHSNTPHMSMSLCGNICIMPPKCSREERRRGFSKRSSVDAAVSGRRCVFLGESKSTLFDLPKVDAFTNHRLRLVYNRKAQPKCLYLCNTFYGRQFCEPRRVQGWLCTKAI